MVVHGTQNCWVGLKNATEANLFDNNDNKSEWNECEKDIMIGGFMTFMTGGVFFCLRERKIASIPSIKCISYKNM